MARPTNIPSLTALRGLAAIAVLLHHYEQILPLPGNVEGLFGRAYLMVDLFFALSGFVMLHVYGAMFAKEVKPGQFMTYMRVRFARIYPLHFAVSLALVGLVAWGHSHAALPQSPAFSAQFDTDALPWVFTLTHAWGAFTTPPWNDPSWSISVEWALYLLFPVMALGLAKLQRRATMALALFGLASVFYVVYVAQPQWAEQMARLRPIEKETMTIATGFALLRGLASFSLGLVAYQLYRERVLIEVLKSDLLCALTFLVVVGNTATGALPDAVAVLLFPVFILQAAYAEGWVMRLLRTRVLDWLGRLSYSIYLTHGPLLLVFLFLLTKNSGGFASYLTAWSALLGFLLASLALSATTYYLVELPARRWLRPRFSA